MAFHEVLFPLDIALGARGGPAYSTAVIETDGGAEERIARWNGARRQWDAGYGIRRQVDVALVQDFFLCREGRAHGFRWRDRFDSTTSADGYTLPSPVDVQIGVGDGSATTFQLVKKYISGPTTKTRNLTKPVAGTVRVAHADVEQTSGFTVDVTTGIVTHSSAPASSVVVKAGCVFDCPARFLDDRIEWSMPTMERVSIASIPIIEIRDDSEIQDDFPFGGAAFTSIAQTSNTTLALADGLARVFLVTAASCQLRMPATTNLQTGGPYMMIGSDSGSTQSCTVRDSTGATTIATLAAGAEVELWLGLDSGGAKKWYAL